VVLGGTTLEEIAQLLGYHDQTDNDRAADDQGQRHTPHHGRLGPVARRPLLFSTGRQSRKARNLGQNPNCVICTEHAQEAIIVEGVAELADVAARRKFLPRYEHKYDWDMSKMKDDILSMKEPVFAVRPRTVFALWEEHFQGKSTRWKFE